MSPAVWNEVSALLLATAATQGVPLSLSLPNEDVGGSYDPPQMWATVDVASALAERLELGINSWSETGSIFVHFFLPSGTGLTPGLTMRKAFSLAFRTAVPTLAGLSYRDQVFEPLGPDDGVYKALTLTVRYTYNDIITD